MSIINDALKKTQQGLDKEEPPAGAVSSVAAAVPLQKKKHSLTTAALMILLTVLVCSTAAIFIISSNRLSVLKAPKKTDSRASTVPQTTENPTADRTDYSAPAAARFNSGRSGRLLLTGIVEVDGTQYAVINDEFFAVGDMIEGNRIAGISPKKVDIAGSDGAMTHLVLP